MKLAICGDSWFCSDLKYPGKSFGEILASRNGWDLLTLARGGCSNFAIALQIDKAIELNANYIVIGPTTPDRIELPIIDDTTSTIWDKLKSSFNFNSWFTEQPKVYAKDRGLSNVQYAPHPDLSSLHEFLKNPTIISESMNNIAFDACNSEFYKLTIDQKTALKAYMVNLYDRGIKMQYDCWIISDACRRLIESKIPFVIFTNNLYDSEFYKDIQWVPPENVINKWRLQELPMTNVPVRFHYCPDSGGKILADLVDEKLKYFYTDKTRE